MRSTLPSCWAVGARCRDCSGRRLCTYVLSVSLLSSGLQATDLPWRALSSGSFKYRRERDSIWLDSASCVRSCVCASTPKTTKTYALSLMYCSSTISYCLELVFEGNLRATVEVDCPTGSPIGSGRIGGTARPSKKCWAADVEAGPRLRIRLWAALLPQRQAGADRPARADTIGKLGSFCFSDRVVVGSHSSHIPQLPNKNARSAAPRSHHLQNLPSRWSVITLEFALLGKSLTPNSSFSDKTDVVDAVREHQPGRHNFEWPLSHLQQSAPGTSRSW